MIPSPRQLISLALASLVTLAAGADAPRSVVVAIRYYQVEGTSHAHLYLFDHEGSLVRQLTHAPSGQDHDPVFSPDGKDIVYQRKTGRTDQWRIIHTSGEGDRALDQPPAWQRKGAANIPEFDLPRFEPVPGQPGERRLYTANRPGDIVFETRDNSAAIVLKDDDRQADSDDPSYHPKQAWLCVGDPGKDVPVNGLPVYGPRRAQGVARFWTGPLPGGRVGHEEHQIDGDGPFVEPPDVLLLADSPFLTAPPLRVAFFTDHRGSTCGRGLFALDLNTRRIFELSPNGGSIHPLAGLPWFACVCDQRYLPLGAGPTSVNCSYLELWDAKLNRIRFAAQKPAIFYGASVFAGTAHRIHSLPSRPLD